MTITFIYTLGAVLAISAISLVGLVTLSMKEAALRASVFFLVSLAAGALFGDAIIHLFPEAIEGLGNPAVAAFWVLAGIVAFFILEKVLHWHHAHGLEDTHTDPDEALRAHGAIKPVGRLVLVSDGLHNFIDGVLIAASFLVSPSLGIATTVAVALHEIPQEIGDFGVLIHAGYSRVKALLWNFLSGLTAVIGAVAVFIFQGVSESLLPALLAVAAGSFLYIAGADLVPEIHETKKAKKSALQLFAMLLGITLMFALLLFE